MEIIKLEKAVELIKEDKERKFDQSVDLIVNLRKFDLKKTQINNFVTLPNKIKDKRVCGFIESKSSIINTIPKSQFPVYKDKKKVKKLVKEYDFFIASAPNMPLVATTFGRVLGPASKMPSPQLGIVVNEEEHTIKELIKKIESVIRARTKEPTIKVAIGKEDSKDEDLAENAMAVHNEVFKSLPRQKENLRSILIKFTMSKPAKVAL